MQALLRALLVIILSGLAYYFSLGFHAAGLLMWFAPIPVLIYVYRAKWLPSLVVAFMVGLVPGINMMLGYASSPIPASVLGISTLAQSIEWTSVVLLSRFFVVRLQGPFSLLAYPTLLSLVEWVQSFTPQGTFGSIAYSQLHFLPALQIAALTGFIGVTFILSLFAACVAYYLAFYRTALNAKWALILSLMVVILSLAYGFYRIQKFDQTKPALVNVGLASYERTTQDIFTPGAADKLLDDYKPLMKLLSQQGANIILLPEDTLTATPSNIADLQKSFAQLANLYHVRLIAGVNEVQTDHHFNSAWVFDAKGLFMDAYHKRHFVPELETGRNPGTNLLIMNTPQMRSGIVICRDLDYQYPAHAYGQERINLLFVPAWDFVVDAYVHASSAIIRGVENGYTVVRVAREGLFTVTTPTGAVIVSREVNGSQGSAFLASVPVWNTSSFYAAHSAGFPIVLWLIVLGLVGLVIRRRKQI